MLTQADMVANARAIAANIKHVSDLVSNNNDVIDTLNVVVPNVVVNDDASASLLSSFMPVWKVGMKLVKDHYFVDGDTGDLYHITSDGTAQAHYKPGMAGLESLFVRVQMRHGHRVYNPDTLGYDYINTGDIVAFYNDWESRWEYYESKINGNTVSLDADDADRYWTYLGTEEELYGTQDD